MEHKLAKCSCGSMLVWGWHDTYGNTWLHWRPSENCLNFEGRHDVVEGSEFTISEWEFDKWNAKTPEELETYMASMVEFWEVLKRGLDEE